MSEIDQTILMIKGAIADLPPAQQAACNELVYQLNRSLKAAGHPVGTLALALVGAEAQKAADQ